MIFTPSHIFEHLTCFLPGYSLLDLPPTRFPFSLSCSPYGRSVIAQHVLVNAAQRIDILHLLLCPGKRDMPCCLLTLRGASHLTRGSTRLKSIDCARHHAQRASLVELFSSSSSTQHVHAHATPSPRALLDEAAVPAASTVLGTMHNILHRLTSSPSTPHAHATTSPETLSDEATVCAAQSVIS